MDCASPHDAAIERARLQGKRVALVMVISVAVAFTAASAVQIIPAVFGLGVTPVPTAPPGSAARRCGDGVRALMAALDRAGSQTLSGISADDEAALEARFRRALSPDWDHADEVREACTSSREGLDAWASLMRLRSAQEELARHGRIELGPLRRDVVAHVSADLR
jgi:hypothetical protein